MSSSSKPSHHTAQQRKTIVFLFYFPGINHDLKLRTKDFPTVSVVPFLVEKTTT